MTEWERVRQSTIYPACIGLARIGSWPKPYTECWNDGKSRKAPWYLRYFPWSVIKWKNTGSYFSLTKLYKKD